MFDIFSKMALDVSPAVRSRARFCNVKGNKNMGFNSLFQSVLYGTNGKRSLQSLKYLFYTGQKQIRFSDGFQARRPAYWNEADSVPHAATFAAGAHYSRLKWNMFSFIGSYGFGREIRTSPKSRPASFFNVTPLYA
jgi:hypothetical protein